MKITQDTPLCDIAEDWMRENGFIIPRRGSESWTRLYETWIAFAFDNTQPPAN